ncbi:MAG: hypothetical protein GY765_22260, partial [bacterium]|nr:hypothetical protein [bacterium]
MANNYIMKIKKYLSQKTKKADIKSRLDAYTRQGRSYRKTGKGTDLSKNFLKGSLAAIIPLAAAGTLNSQCLTDVVTLNLNPSQKAGFDVDGDGMDDFSVSFFKSSSTASNSTSLILRLHAKAGFSLLANGNVTALTTGTVTRAQTPFANSGLLYSMRYDASGTMGMTMPNFPVAGARGSYVGIRKGNATTGQPGWIELQIDDLDKTSATIKIYDRGIDNTSNPDPNKAQVGTCDATAEGMDAVVPVEMLYFRPKVADKNILLEWATASELNNAGFEVQRSKDGKSFAKIGWVDGRGTTLDKQEYVFTDTEVQPNTSYYYRLRQMDND